MCQQLAKHGERDVAKGWGGRGQQSRAEEEQSVPGLGRGLEKLLDGPGKEP